MPNYSDKPILIESDEEYDILIEISEEFDKQKIDKNYRDKFGSPTQTVIRNHLRKRNLNISTMPDVTIQGSNIKCDLVVLKNGIESNQGTFPSDKVKMVIEVKNSGVSPSVGLNGKREDPNKMLRAKFNELEAMANVKNFSVIVISETLLGSPFKWRFKEKAINKQNCKVFTLVARQLYPSGGLYIKSNIIEMLEKGQLRRTGEFEQLIHYLKCL